MAGPPFAGYHDVLETVPRPSGSPPAGDATNHPLLGQHEESSMRRCGAILALRRINIAEELAALIGHGEVCEGGGPVRE